MKTLFEDDDLKISAQKDAPENGPGAVLLSFTGIGHKMGGINVQHPEFFGIGKKFSNIVFISDKNRTWGNSLNFDNISAVTAPLAEGKELYAIGNSMGGFLAIVASRYLPISKSISFAPQFSVDPSEVPWETRWSQYRMNILEHKIANAAPYFGSAAKYYIFSGRQGLDGKHAELFPVGGNIFHYTFPDLGHNVAIELKAKGLLHDLVHRCFEGNEPLDTGLPFERLSPSVAESRLT